MQGIIIIFMVAQISSISNLGIINTVRLIPKEKQDETLITGKTRIGAFGGPIIKFTELNNQFGVLVGGRGGLIINRSLVIGGGGYGLVNDIEINDFQPPARHILEFGYGGIILEYINRSAKLIHLDIHSLIGGGCLCYQQAFYPDWQDDLFFVVEPGLDMIFNITEHFRIGLGGSYRFVNGIDLNGLKDGDINGPAASLTFKFGKF
jgi:hypothetical protein